MRAPSLSPALVDEIAARMGRVADIRARDLSIPYPDALRAVAGEMRASENTMAKIHERNQLMSWKSLRDTRQFVTEGFPTFGEGVRALLGGVQGTHPKARFSVDVQTKAIHGEYFGRFLAEIEKNGLYHKFKRMSDELQLDLFRELHAGSETSVTGNVEAHKLARIISSLNDEVVARKNRAGSYIMKLPGYILRQTHDIEAIRHAGEGSQQLAFQRWRDYVLPLLNHERTFQGADPETFLKLVHEELYTGVYGKSHQEADVSGIHMLGSLASKTSAQRVLHFKDADSAFLYNKAFGIKDFKEAMLTSLHSDARAIALMETLGPNPRATLDALIRQLQEESRLRDDGALQADSLKDWRIEALFNEVTGANEQPANVSLNRFASTVRVWTQLSKMGAVVLSSFADKAFLQTEMAYQGISHLNTLGKQISTFAPRSPQRKEMLRMIGTAMDGIIGNALQRYSSHSTVSGWTHNLQRWFFDLNGLNLWTDAHKAAAAELMAANLGENSGKFYSELPVELSRVLSLYGIDDMAWNAIRTTAYEQGDNGAKFITPDQIRNLDDRLIEPLVRARGQAVTPANLLRERDRLSTALRTYLIDRTDIAVPTPGATERMYATWNTQAGTPLGEAVRMIMLFKSFPITIMNKIVGRTIYGQGAESLKQWLLHDRRGLWNMAQLIAMTTAAGYLSGVARDALKGRSPKPLILDDGTVNVAALNDAALRGGGLGILGDYLISEYDTSYKSFLKTTAGPVIGQLDTLAGIKSELQRGEIGMASGHLGKMTLDNTPMINLFYIRPILDYLILWNLQEMMDPGSLRRMERGVERKNNQGFFIRPSEVVR